MPITTLSVPLRVASGGPQGELVLDQTTDFAATYRGPAERALFTFTSIGPDQFGWGIVDQFLRNRYLLDAVDAVEHEGGRVLEVKLWRDTSPTWSTRYTGILTVAPGPSLTQGAALRAFPFALVIGVALLGIVAYLLVKPTIESVTDLMWGPANTEGERPGILSSPWLIVGILVVAVMALGRKTT